MAAIVNAQRSLAAIQLASHPLAHAAMNGQKVLQSPAENPVASKLKVLDSETLGKLQRSFFDTAAGPSGKLPAQMAFAPFSVKTPTEAFASNFASMGASYFSADQHITDSAAETEAVKSDEKMASTKSPDQPQVPKSEPKLARARTTYGAQSKGPGLFSNPTADKAAEAVRQSQAQTQNFLANQLGGSFAAGNMAEFLGPNACFEDVLAAVMMNIADRSEKEMLEQVRTVERGESGLNGFIGNRARDVGGIAGGVIGGALGGPGGAAIGYDIGDRLVGGIASQNGYGGSSRQIQFEKLKMTMHKQSEMMSAISNILATIHATNKNTIGNIRG